MIRIRKKVCRVITVGMANVTSVAGKELETVNADENSAKNYRD